MDSDRTKDAKAIREALMACDELAHRAGETKTRDMVGEAIAALDRLTAPAPVDGDVPAIVEQIRAYSIKHLFYCFDLDRHEAAALISSALRQARRETVERCEMAIEDLIAQTENQAGADEALREIRAIKEAE
jgi:hypothetical protein